MRKHNRKERFEMRDGGIKLIRKREGKVLLCNILVLVVLLSVASPRYMYDTDIMMQALLFDVAGVWSTGMILFSNIYLGRGLSLLCEVFDGINWYTLMQYVLVFIALCRIGETFLKENRTKLASIIYGVFVIFVGYECYILPTYMKTAALLCVSAIYTIYEIMVWPKKKGSRYCFVGVALFLSGLISWKAAAISGTIGFLCLLAYFVIRRQKIKKDAILLFSILLPLILTSVLWMLDICEYKKLEGWDRAAQYRDDIEQIEMFGAPYYREEIGAKTGLTAEQYENLVQGHFVSFDGSAMDKMHKVAESGHDFTGENILRFFRTLPAGFIEHGIVYGAVILWALSYFSKKEKKRMMAVFSVTMTIVGCFVLYMAAACEGSAAYFMILLPIYMLALMNCGGVRASVEEVKQTGIYLALAGTVLYMNLGRGIVTSVAQGSVQENLQAFVQMSDSSWHQICLNDYLRGYSVFCRYDAGAIGGKNLIIIDGAYTIIPIYNGVVYPVGWTIDQTTDSINVSMDQPINSLIF